MVWKVKFFLLMGVLCALFMAPEASFAGKTEAQKALKEAEGKIYYTAVNIWYEDPKDILSTNYHKGRLLPINTQVKIGTIRKSGITFTDNDNMAYMIKIVIKHTPNTLEDVFNNYFSESQISLLSLNGEEKRNVEAGTIGVGMSKKAVIAAYGYPPAHMTPSLESNQWKYWKDRFRNFFVFFNNEGNVIRIGRE
ncbi:MAG: hypothetical protein HQL27_00955 [Candidatus Omnitrophica bacterium]|nr:hypothetical protein [Candidatus Omnitrophota bacterium]